MPDGRTGKAVDHLDVQGAGVDVGFLDIFQGFRGAMDLQQASSHDEALELMSDFAQRAYGAGIPRSQIREVLGSIIPDNTSWSAEADEIVQLYRTREALTEEQRGQMEEIRSELGTKFCRRCEYCKPCQQGIDIPLVLGMWSYVKRLQPQMIIGLADANMKKVGDCIECGECIERCPYELPIPELIQESLALYRAYVKEHT